MMYSSWEIFMVTYCIVIFFFNTLYLDKKDGDSILRNVNLFRLSIVIFILMIYLLT